MSKLPTISTLFCCFVLSLLFTNCASLTGFQTAQTVGEGNGEFMASINASQSPDFDISFNDSTDFENIFFPNIELSGRYGIAEKFDMGVRMNTNLNLAVDGKYQVLGDQESEVAMALGAGIGTFGAFSALWNFQVPVYFSFHPNEKIDLYVNPRFIVQFSAGDINANLRYFGGNAGVLFGTKVKFGIDAGIYNINATGGLDLQSIATVGVGVKVPFE